MDNAKNIEFTSIINLYVILYYELGFLVARIFRI